MSYQPANLDDQPNHSDEVYYYISESHDPFYNISLEDYLYQARRDCDRIYFFWINTPSVFMGRYQCAQAETDWVYLQAQHIPILRRSSGGGTVYHDTGNLNYTCILNSPERNGFDLKAFPRPIINALAHEGVELTLSPRGDLRFEGLKVGGSAEATRQGRMLYHMSLLFDADLDQLERVLSVPKQEVARSRVSSVRSRVCNLSSVLPRQRTILEFRDLILEEIHRQYPELRPLELDEEEANAYIHRVREQRFANESWIHSSIGRKA